MTGGDQVAIILVEDDDGHAELIQRNLQRANTSGVVRFREGNEALQYLRSERPSHPVILLADIKMPGMGGVELLQAVRSDAELALTPVIILTTTDDPREIERCYALGCNLYVTKSVDYSTFTESVQRIGGMVQIMAFPSDRIDPPENR